MKQSSLSDSSIAVPVGAAAAWIGRLLLLLAAAAAPSPAATAVAGQVIQAKSVQYADVSAAVQQAADGDTVEVPAGTATWSQELKITKGITLAGKTTTRGAGTKNATANDQTIIIVADAPGSLSLLTFSTSQPFRLTGFTLRPGAKDIPDRALTQSVISLSGQHGVAFRMDNMHLDGIKRRAVWCGGWSIGVIDSTIIRSRRAKGQNHASFRFDQRQWNGHGEGNGAWADYPWLGTDKFVFVEDSTIFGSVEEGGSGNVDASAGARFVIRHNYFSQATVAAHGTADNATGRGTRCAEVYNNIFDWDGREPHDCRTGTYIWHDNAWPTKIGRNADYFITLPVFREYNRAFSWGYAQGTNPWDQNDTEGDGTFVELHPPKTFEAGTATSASIRSNKGSTFGDNSKHWKPGQWKGYSITNVSSPEKYFGMWIVDNTENTITHTPGQGLKFASGEKYEIHRVVRALDQSGAGKGDLLKSQGNHVINTVTGEASYPHQQQETCYEWNNTHTPTGQALKFNAALNCSIKEGRDYINLGNGRPADTIPGEVKQFYTAEVNGVAYVGEFTYPHPLRRGSAAEPTTTADRATIDRPIIEQLRKAGVVFTETSVAVTGAVVKDTADMTDENFTALGSLKNLKTLNIFNRKLNDQTLGLLTGMTDLEVLLTDSAQFSDAGLTQFSKFPNLKHLALIHTSLGRNDFTGKGLAALAALPNLRRLGIGGSKFNDDGMAAVAKLTQLEDLRIGHTYQTEAGNVHFKSLAKLKILWLGQSLQPHPNSSQPLSLSEATLDVLVELKSLETLQLSQARLTADALARLRALPKLKRLSLANIELSADEVAKLKAALPGVTVDWKPLSDEDRAKLDQFLKRKS